VQVTGPYVARLALELLGLVFELVPVLEVEGLGYLAKELEQTHIPVFQQQF